MFASIEPMEAELSSSSIPVETFREVKRSSVRSLYQAFSPSEERSADVNDFSTTTLDHSWWPPKTLMPTASLVVD